jgi:hypothetical protein
MPAVRTKKAKLMIWKSPSGRWHLTLWVPFHGQWTLAKHVKKPMFDRKAKQIINLMPDMEVEMVDKAPKG